MPKKTPEERFDLQCRIAKERLEAVLYQIKKGRLVGTVMFGMECQDGGVRRFFLEYKSNSLPDAQVMKLFSDE